MNMIMPGVLFYQSQPMLLQMLVEICTAFTSVPIICIKLNSKKKGAQQNIHVGVSLLVAAGDIETNPGPGRKPKFPCGICQRAVKNSDAALECDSCNSWIHNKCSGVTDDSYNLYINMQCFNWICPSCEVLNFC